MINISVIFNFHVEEKVIEFIAINNFVSYHTPKKKKTSRITHKKADMFQQKPSKEMAVHARSGSNRSPSASSQALLLAPKATPVGLLHESQLYETASRIIFEDIPPTPEEDGVRTPLQRQRQTGNT